MHSLFTETVTSAKTVLSSEEPPPEKVPSTPKRKPVAEESEDEEVRPVKASPAKRKIKPSKMEVEEEEEDVKPMEVEGEEKKKKANDLESEDEEEEAPKKKQKTKRVVVPVESDEEEEAPRKVLGKRKKPAVKKPSRKIDSEEDESESEAPPKRRKGRDADANRHLARRKRNKFVDDEAGVDDDDETEDEDEDDDFVVDDETGGEASTDEEDEDEEDENEEDRKALEKLQEDDKRLAIQAAKELSEIDASVRAKQREAKEAMVEFTDPAPNNRQKKKTKKVVQPEQKKVEKAKKVELEPAFFEQLPDDLPEDTSRSTIKTMLMSSLVKAVRRELMTKVPPKLQLERAKAIPVKNQVTFLDEPDEDGMIYVSKTLSRVTGDTGAKPVPFQLISTASRLNMPCHKPLGTWGWITEYPALTEDGECLEEHPLYDRVGFQHYAHFYNEEHDTYLVALRLKFANGKRAYLHVSSLNSQKISAKHVEAHMLANLLREAMPKYKLPNTKVINPFVLYKALGATGMFRANGQLFPYAHPSYITDRRAQPPKPKPEPKVKSNGVSSKKFVPTGFVLDWTKDLEPWLLTMGNVLMAYLDDKAPADGDCKKEASEDAFNRIKRAARQLCDTSGSELVTKAQGYLKMKLKPSPEEMFMAINTMAATMNNPVWDCLAATHAEKVEKAYAENHKKKKKKPVEITDSGLVEL